MENITLENEKISENPVKDFVSVFLWMFRLKGYARGFLWMFIGILGLVKAFYIFGYFLHGLPLRSMDHKWVEKWTLHQEMEKKREFQLEELIEKNKKLENLVQELKEYNALQEKNSEEPQQEPTNCLNNVYIKNNHYHLTNQMFVNGEHFDLNTANSAPLAPNVEPNIWMKYLKQRQSLMPCESIVDATAMIEDTPGRHEPTIMGTQEMEELQGMRPSINA
ncbi:uncharacterized protein LOC117589514 [Drosophila guanche]|uniref:Uncharacterized protein n=1 Tax=Drosophila guanche TaxID=7266 RepID=A0A3B0JJB0_DROGU|nr:uncharacterized protein LOC117589514 [Drosophila guanche]SPP73316.1 Hypothetical predicted protein [Drosophila guanche]